MKRETVVRNAARLSTLLLLAGVLAPQAHAVILTTGVLSTGSHRVVVDSLELMDLGGGLWRYRTAGEWHGDTVVLDTFVCTPPMGFPPTLALLWGVLDDSAFTRPIASIVPDTWYIIPSTPTEVMVTFSWFSGLQEYGRPGLARAGLTVSPSILRTATTVRAERVAGMRCSFEFYDAVGNRVRTVRTQAYLGTAAATWTGDDDFGQRLPEGIYYCCMGGGASSTALKIVLTN